jgi:hypothetical protein
VILHLGSKRVWLRRSEGGCDTRLQDTEGETVLEVRGIPPYAFIVTSLTRPALLLRGGLRPLLRIRVLFLLFLREQLRYLPPGAWLAPLAGVRAGGRGRERIPAARTRAFAPRSSKVKRGFYFRRCPGPNETDHPPGGGRLDSLHLESNRAGGRPCSHPRTSAPPLTPPPVRR